mmetsp:Transcript_41579/g.97326  ORF Transcript_41579/g.97326 Transcript_41579/m.97326 type:complete len:166 (-) Transcript_41579:685-1182(-)
MGRLGRSEFLYSFWGWGGGHGVTGHWRRGAFGFAGILVAFGRERTASINVWVGPNIVFIVFVSIENRLFYGLLNRSLFFTGLFQTCFDFGLIFNFRILRYKGTDRLVATPGDGTIMSKGGYNHMTMNGKEVYKFATREVPTVLEEALQEAGLTVDDVDWLLLHQV